MSETARGIDWVQSTRVRQGRSVLSCFNDMQTKDKIKIQNNWTDTPVGPMIAAARRAATSIGSASVPFAPLPELASGSSFVKADMV